MPLFSITENVIGLTNRCIIIFPTANFNQKSTTGIAAKPPNFCDKNKRTNEIELNCGQLYMTKLMEIVCGCQGTIKFQLIRFIAYFPMIINSIYCYVGLRYV